MDRMKAQIALCGGPVFLLWFSSRDASDTADSLSTGHPPQFITSAMMETLRSHTDDVVEITSTPGDTTGMRFSPLDTFAAREAIPLSAHAEAAQQLRPSLMQALV